MMKIYKEYTFNFVKSKKSFANYKRMLKNGWTVSDNRFGVMTLTKPKTLEEMRKEIENENK